jgi:hypothetical protein
MIKTENRWCSARVSRRTASLALCAALWSACAESRVETREREGQPVIASTSQALVKPAIYASDDVQLRSDQPFANAGPSSELRVSKSGATTKYVSLLKFAQSAISAAVGSNKLYSAKIQLQIKSIPQGWRGARVVLHRMTRSWTEGSGAGSASAPGSGPTWSCARDTNTFNSVDNCATADKWSLVSGGSNPLPYTPLPTAAAPIYSPHGAIVLELDVTADVTAFLSGTANHGWALLGTTATPAGEVITFDSSESLFAPALILDVGPDECPSDPNKVAAGKCGCGRDETDTDGDGDPNCNEPSLVASADATLNALDTYANWGTDKELGATTASVFGLEQTLVRFDQAQIVNAVGAGNTLFGAELELTIVNVPIGWGGQELEILRMTRSWVEGNNMDTLLGARGASWVCAEDTNTTASGNWSNDCTTANRWGMSPEEGPVPFDQAPTDRAQIYTAGTKKIRFDVTADIKKFLTGTPNHGWTIRGRLSVADALWVLFGSRESTTPPRLYINAGPPCGSPAEITDERGFLRQIQCQDGAGSFTLCEQRVIAKFNTDAYAAASQYVAKVLDSADVLATVRDRITKRDGLRANATLRQQFCDGDDDEDMVPNAVDACLQTRPLRATDASGCELTSLPSAPPRGLVDAIMGTYGVVHDPRCDGAGNPATPERPMASFILSTPTTPTSLLIAVNDITGSQPAGCELEYQVEAVVTDTTGKRRFVTWTFSSNSFKPAPGTGRVSLIARANEGPDRAVLTNNVAHIWLRVRIMNGNGVLSGWSPAREGRVQ